ncbi:MAG TPA: sodium-dependent transporter [Steroidobacteraceae bacterium]
MSADTRVETWSSNLAFYLSVAGAAIGLGTLWRFPFLVGRHGGGLFVLVFIAACLIIAVPLLIAEFMIGRRGGPNVPLAAGRVATQSGRSPRWAAIGIFGTLAVFLIMTYYSVIGGWILSYVGAYATGGAADLDQAGLTSRFATLLADPWRLAFWHAVFMGATVSISAGGIQRGIEIGNKIMMPGLFGILLALAIYALYQGNPERAIAFLTQVDLSRLSGELVLAAVGQAFFATGVGMAIMIAYGSHVAAGTSLPPSAAVVALSIVLASVLSSLLIFPLVFASGVDPAQGPQLAFIVMPSIFIGMPGGALIGALFFVLLAFAALTSSIAGLEPAGAWLMERFGMRRMPAVALVAATAWLLGLATVFSFNYWSDVYPLAAIARFRTATIFELTDFFASNVLLPVGALLTSVLVGWRLERKVVDAEFGGDSGLRRALIVLLKYVCPIAIVGVLIGAM